MRKWAYLATALDRDGESIKKIMVYETDSRDAYVFLYHSDTAQTCAHDEWYATLDEALAAWSPLIAATGWTVIDDPLPDCQHDAFLPLRVKGRNTEKPQWGQYELLTDSGWVDYHE